MDLTLKTNDNDVIYTYIARRNCLLQLLTPPPTPPKASLLCLYMFAFEITYLLVDLRIEVQPF